MAMSSQSHTPFSDQKPICYKPVDIPCEPRETSGRIFLGRIRKDVERETLVNTLSKFGKVLDARIVSATKDGFRKRFAFCDLETHEAAANAIRALHGSTCIGAPGFGLVATFSTDTTPSSTWNSSSYYKTSFPTISAGNTALNQPSVGSKPSSYGLAWHPAHHHSTMAVTAPPPPPPPGSKKNSPGEKESYSSSKYSSGGCAVADGIRRTPSPPVAEQEDHAEPQHEDSAQQEYPYPHQAPLPIPHIMDFPSPMPLPGHAMPHHAAIIAAAPPPPPPPAFADGQLTTLYIRNLPLDMDEMGLLHFYMPFGAIVATKILRNFDSMNSRGAGFIEFFTRQESDAALKATHKTTGPNGRELLVQYAPRQLHTSRAASAVSAPPVWPVMPYPAPPPLPPTAAAAVVAAAGTPQNVAAAIPNAEPTSTGPVVPVTVSVAAMQPPPPPAAGMHAGTHTAQQVALALGHPVHAPPHPAAAYQVVHPFIPYHQMMNPYQPSHGGAPPPAGAAAATWWQQHHQQRYPRHVYQHPQQQYNPRYHDPQQYYLAHMHANSGNGNAVVGPAAAAATQHNHHHQQRSHSSSSHSKPASSADSSGSDTNSTISARRPGDPVIVVYGNHMSKQLQHQQHPHTLAAGPAHYAMPTYTPAGRYPLRNVSNANGGSGGSQSQSAAATPVGSMPLGPQSYQKNTLPVSGSGGSNAVGLERTLSDPFPSSLSPSEMEAICSRVKAAARDVNNANAALAAIQTKHNGCGGNGGGGSGTPDLVINPNNNTLSSVNTVDSDDSLDSVADSVASCVTSAPTPVASGGAEAAAVGVALSSGN